MSRSRLSTVALAAMLVAATPALAGNGGNTGQQVEQLGPKHLLGSGPSRMASRTRTTRLIPITFRTMLVEELGPKYLLGK